MENKEIWERLRDLRLKKKLTYGELSNQLTDKYGNLGFSVSTLKAYESISEKNRRVLTKQAIMILSDFYGVSPLYLFDEKYTNKTDKNISINKELGFSDKTISRIKECRYKSSLDSLLVNINFQNLSYHLYCIDRYREIIRVCIIIIKYLDEEISKNDLLEKLSKYHIRDINDMFEYDISDKTSYIENVITSIKGNSIEKKSDYTMILNNYIFELAQLFDYRKYQVNREINYGLDSISL